MVCVGLGFGLGDEETASIRTNDGIPKVDRFHRQPNHTHIVLVFEIGYDTVQSPGFQKWCECPYSPIQDFFLQFQLRSPTRGAAALT